MIDDPVPLVIIGRILERVIAISGAILALWCGFRLFYVAATQDSSAELTVVGYKFVMTKVGPGVFFALFGSLIMIYSITSQISISSKELEGLARPTGTEFERQMSVRNTQKNRRSVQYVGIVPVEKDDVPTTIRAVNTLVDIVDRQGKGATVFSERDTVHIKKSAIKLKYI